MKLDVTAVVSVAVAFVFGGAGAVFADPVTVNWADYKGQTYTVAAGAEVSVSETDMADFNQIAALSFADATGKVVFDGCTTAPDVEVTGKGTIEKLGTGVWSLSRQLPNFTGPYLIGGGFVSMLTNNVLGALSTSGGNIVVADGATLCISNRMVHFKNRLVRFAGSGFGTAGGALTFFFKTDNSASMFTQGWSLDGDASVYIENGSDPYLKGKLDLNGHTLRKFGTGHLMHYGGRTNGGAVIVEPGTDADHRTGYTLRENGVVARADPLTPIYLNNFTMLRFWNNDPPQDGPLYASGDVLIWRSNQGSSGYLFETPDYNNWLGPIVMSNAETTITFSHNGGSQSKTGIPFTNRLHVTGCISGPGTVAATGNGRLYLDCPTNAWTGTTTYTRGNNSMFSRIIFGAPGSLPDYSKYTANGMGTRVNLASNLWTVGSIVRLLNEATYSSGTTRGVAFDTTCAADRTDFVVSGADVVAVTNTTQFLEMSELGKTVTITGGTDVIELPKLLVDGGTLRLAGPTTKVRLNRKTYVGAFESDDWATLRIEDGADVEIPSEQLSNPFEIGKPDGGTVSNPKCRLVVSNATLRTEHWKRSYVKSGTNALWIASGTKLGLVETYDGAIISNKLVMGGAANTTAAVHQHGGRIAAFGDWGGSTATATIIGYYFGHGYWLIEDGVMEGLGVMCVGQNNATAVFEMRGGTYDQQTYNKNAGFYVASSAGGCRASLVCRGNSRFNGSAIVLGTGTSTGYPGSEGSLTVAENALVKVGSCTLSAVNAESRGVVNLNGGVLEAGYICGSKKNRQYDEGAWPEVMSVNFNGGTLRCANNDAAVFSYRYGPGREGNSAAPRVFVYGGGATLDVPADNKVYVHPPIERPYGGGVESIVYTTTEYAVAPPVIRIEGDGTGATAVCDYDPKCGLVTGVTVTSRGNGYTHATAYFITGSSKTSTNATVACSITSNETASEQSGGVTKTGDGILVLQATNEWRGVTTVAGGTVQLDVDYALPSNACVRLAGGTLNLNGKVAVITNLVYAAGGGQVSKISAATLPETFSLETTVDDIAAGKAIALTGNVSIAGVSLTVAGSDFSALDETKKGGYPVVTATGTLTGAPVVTAPLPQGWVLRQRGNGLNLVFKTGSVLIVK